MRFRSYIILLAALATTPILAQTAPQHDTPTATDAQLSFAAVTINPHDPNDPCIGCSDFSTDGDRMKIRNKAAADLMKVGFAIQPRQIVNAPEWFFHETFDIAGTTNTPGEPTTLQWESVLQNLLADRFALKFHREKRVLPAYVLQVTKSGAKIKPSRPDEQPDGNDNRNGNDETITFAQVSIADFLMRLQLMTDRPIVDGTGLTGKYDIALHYTVDETRATDPNAPPGLFTAIQDQLGLKLQATKAPVDVFVIDHIDHPSPN